MKMPTIVLLLAFSNLLAEKISCLAELSMKKVLYTLGPVFALMQSVQGSPYSHEIIGYYRMYK